MFDLIGKRRWFYLFSALITIPGLIFIILTPLTGGKVGLQFSIDFTGGTVWEVHFANGTPSTGDVQAVMAAQGSRVWLAGRIRCRLSCRVGRNRNGFTIGGPERIACTFSITGTVRLRGRRGCRQQPFAFRIANDHRQYPRAYYRQAGRARNGSTGQIRPNRRGPPGGEHRPDHQR